MAANQTFTMKRDTVFQAPSGATPMKTIHDIATSLDGFIADQDNSLDWPLQFGEPGEDYHEFITGVGDIAMGSTTYEWLLDHHVRPG